ncbi:ABC transporter substrate-binding protein [Inquilinus limosus]|uniref:ABC transporter substrate-binding protein n=1 Tax=Inquilinus limosus TaxID=171674 RepID=UPI003F17F189
MRKFVRGAVAAILLGCATLPARAETPKDTLVQAYRIDDIITLDPAEVFEFSATEYVAQVYDRLIYYNAEDPANFRPGIAESWAVSDDGRTFTFKIRDGVKFHSGNPLTAEDAAYSIRRAVKLNLSPGFIIGQFGLTADNVDQMVTAPDARTLLFRTDKAYAPSFVLNCLSATVASVVDSKLVEEHAKNGDFGHDWLNTHSAGSGPYKLVAWKPNESLVIEQFDDYWQGKPGFRRIFFRHVLDPTSQFLLLQKGDVDIARGLTGEQIESLKSNPDIALQEVPRGTIWYLAMNTQTEPLKKVEVRQALKYLIDYRGMADSFMKGRAVLHENFLPKGFLGAVDDEPFKLDVDKAKQLLAQGGYPDGFKITIDVSDGSPYLEMAQSIQATFAKAGVEVQIIASDDKQTTSKVRARKHQLAIGRWGPDYQDPHTNAQNFAMNVDNGDNPPMKTTAWRNAWDIPELTRETEAAVLETDTARRQAMYEALQRKVRDAGPYAFMFQQVEAVAARKSVQGLVWGPGTENDFFWQGKKE